MLYEYITYWDGKLKTKYMQVRSDFNVAPSFCSCCGSSYNTPVTPDRKVIRNRYGISLSMGDFGRNVNGPKNTVTVVNTRNGPVTIAIRKEL